MPRIKDVPRETTGKSQPEGETCSTWNVTAPRASKRGTRSPQRAFARYPISTRPPIVGIAAQDQPNRAGLVSTHRRRRIKTEIGKRRHVPPDRGVSLGRLGHHQLAAGAEEAGGALGDNRRRPERPGDDQIEARAQIGLACQHLGSAATHLDPTGEPEVHRGALEEFTSPTLGVEQDPSRARPRLEQDETRETATAPEVQHVALERADEVGEVRGMPQLRFYRSWTEHAQPPRVLEDVDQAPHAGGRSPDRPRLLDQALIRPGAG